MHALAFYISYFFIYILSLFPLRIVYVFSDALYVIGYYLIGYRKKVVFRNLQNSFPEKSKEELVYIAKRFYKHLFDTFFETFVMLNLSKGEFRKRYTIINPELLDELFKRKKSVSAVMAHYGNWEWITILPDYIKHKTIGIYHPLKNKYFDNFINTTRIRFGLHLTPMSSVLKATMMEERNENLCILLFISDQTPSNPHSNYWARFLNQDTLVFMGAEKIAKKFNHAVVYLKVEKVKRGYYETEVVLIEEEATNAKEYEITNKHLQLLENQIINKPEFWLWSHKRWKHKRNE
ncbi:lysophospholipid acyltransferase family protein [Bacteroidota bacterium]